MSTAIVGRWGKNLAVRFPGHIATATGLSEGETISIETDGNAIVIRRVAPKIDLDTLFAGKTSEEWRREYAHAYDWGPDVGRERVE
jgi:antitoxin component of MazEF toxin-antitoxin module